MADTNNLKSISDFAKEKGVHETTVRNHIKDELIETVQIGKAKFIDSEKYKDYIFPEIGRRKMSQEEIIKDLRERVKKMEKVVYQKP